MDEKVEILDPEVLMLLDNLRLARASFRDRAIEGRNELVIALIKEEAELRIGGIL